MLRSAIRGAALATGSASTIEGNYPDDVEAGDTLIFAMNIFFGDSGTTSATGWTKLDQTQAVGNSHSLFYRTADGTEGGTTFTVDPDTTVRDTTILCVSVMNPTDTPEFETASGASTQNPDPPSITPTGGDGTYAIISFVGTDFNSDLDDGIHGYGGWAIAKAGDAGGFLHHLTDSGTTFDPGTFRLEDAREWFGYTVAVPTSLSNDGFPTVESYEYEVWTTPATSQTLTLPSGISADDLLVAEITTEGDLTVTIDDWTELTSANEGANTTVTILYKVADGSEGASVTVNLSSSDEGSAVVRRISGATDTGIEGATNTGNTTTVTFPTLTPAAGADDILWIGGFGSDTYLGTIGTGTSGIFSPRFAIAGAFARPYMDLSNDGTYSAGYAANLSSVQPVTLEMGSPRRFVAYVYAIYPAAPPVPDAPTNPSATALSGSQIQVTWDNVADETGYRVERSDDGSSGWTDVSGNLAADTTQFDDSGLSAETQYFYRVFAFNANGDSDPSSTVNATTLEATSGNRMGGTGAIRKPPRNG